MYATHITNWYLIIYCFGSTLCMSRKLYESVAHEDPSHQISICKRIKNTGTLTAVTNAHTHIYTIQYQHRSAAYPFSFQLIELAPSCRILRAPGVPANAQKSKLKIKILSPRIIRNYCVVVCMEIITLWK